MTSMSRHPDVLSWCHTDLVGWLTTVAPDGQPQSSIVWHVVDGDDLVIYSRPDATRLVNLAANPLVAYNLRGDRRGDHMVTLEGRAMIDGSLPSPLGNPTYVAKYRAEILRLGWTPEWYSSTFSTPIRLFVTRIRSW